MFLRCQYIGAIRNPECCSAYLLELEKNLLKYRIFTIKAPIRTVYWLKVPTSAFTFKTLIGHYAKWVCVNCVSNVKELVGTFN